METNNQLTVAPVRKKAIEIRREMVKIPAIMSTFSPVDKAVFLASTDKTISEYDSVELATELNTALKWIAKDIGYRDNDESERQYLVIRTAEILKRYYSGFTMKDFRMAFEMSITGELDEFLPKGRDGQAERNHYQQFNAEYICRILNAYRGRRAQVLKRAQDKLPDVELPPDPEYSRYCRNQNRQMCIDAFLNYKYRGHLGYESSLQDKLIYDVLTKCGLADAINVTDAEQQALIDERIKELCKQGNWRKAKRLQDDGSEMEFSAYLKSRRKAIKSTFDWMLEREYQITDYVTFEVRK